MNNIVVFGAGKSATCLIDYLTDTCLQKNWSLTIGDMDAEALKKKLVPSPNINPVQLDIEDAAQRNIIIEKADLVISLLPPHLHIRIALDCLNSQKSLLTASYVSDDIRKLGASIKKSGLLFLCEMGLDPGIDHMSAMQIIHRIHARGGIITRFLSHTGGLVAPESDDNPWHYKVSWNPANVVRAGAEGAIFRQAGEIKEIPYEKVFENTGEVDIEPMGSFAWYPNRDSLNYIPLYGLESTRDFIRTTLRHPDYCAGWKNLVSSGLTSFKSEIPLGISTVSEWSRPLLPYVNEFNFEMYNQLGLFSDEKLRGNTRVPAVILQDLIERNWKMRETDKDMILMLHEFEYTLDRNLHSLRSSLIVKGENAMRTAMAKTVGLPLGIAARLILEGKIKLTGLHIPIIPELYEPVLEELSREGIHFKEKLN
jgi:saccharopine dehydrogenase-like NADP-dependent oxidoreductase